MNAITPLDRLLGLTKEELAERIMQMQANATKPNRLSFKVSEKGALSVYGLGRFPVTLYRAQWERLIAAQPELEAFITANASLLATKPAA